MRGAFTRNEARVSLGGQVVHYLRADDLSAVELSRLCANADLLILPSTKDRPDCPALTEADLRHGGSVSVRSSSEGLQLQTSRQVRGNRLWVR